VIFSMITPWELNLNDYIKWHSCQFYIQRWWGSWFLRNFIIMTDIFPDSLLPWRKLSNSTSNSSYKQHRLFFTMQQGSGIFY
jgi:hypothetical protein